MNLDQWQGIVHRLQMKHLNRYWCCSVDRLTWGISQWIFHRQEVSTTDWHFISFWILPVSRRYRFDCFSFHLLTFITFTIKYKITFYTKEKDKQNTSSNSGYLFVLPFPFLVIFLLLFSLFLSFHNFFFNFYYSNDWNTLSYCFITHQTQWLGVVYFNKFHQITHIFRYYLHVPNWQNKYTVYFSYKNIHTQTHTSFCSTQQHTTLSYFLILLFCLIKLIHPFVLWTLISIIAFRWKRVESRFP